MLERNFILRKLPTSISYYINTNKMHLKRLEMICYIIVIKTLFMLIINT